MEKKNRCVIITVHQSSDTMYYVGIAMWFFTRRYIVDNGLNVN